MTGKSTIWCSATSLKWMAGHSMLVSYVLEYVCRAGMDAIPEHWRVRSDAALQRGECGWGTFSIYMLAALP